MLEDSVLMECQNAYDQLKNRGVIEVPFPEEPTLESTIPINLQKLRSIYGYVLWYDTQCEVSLLSTQDPMLTPFEPYILCFDSIVPLTSLQSIVLQPFQFGHGSRNFRKK